MNKDSIFELKDFNEARAWCNNNPDYVIVEIDPSPEGTHRFTFNLKYEIAHAEELKAEKEYKEKKNRLKALSEDFIQYQAGLNITELNTKKTEFQTLLNEIRTYEGKDPKEVRDG